MKNSFKKSFMYMMLLLALTFSALGVTPALADDGVTPPTDAPAVEQPVGDAPVVDAPAAEEPLADAPVVDAPVAEEPVVADAPAVEEPVADAPAAEPTAEEMTVPEILEQLPEDTGLVVLDENGETLPLASQEAAEAVASSTDPYFYDTNGVKYSYMFPGQCGTTPNCTESSNPIQAAVDDFEVKGGSGNIVVEAGTYTGDVFFHHSMTGLTGLIGAGSGSTTLDGSVWLDHFFHFGVSNFTLSGFTIKDLDASGNNTGVRIMTEGDVTLSDLVVVGGSGIDVMVMEGDLTVTNVNSSDNHGYGLVGRADTINVTDSVFNNNDMSGMRLYGFEGQVTLDHVMANGNGNSGATFSQDPTITCSIFSGNGGYGLTSHMGGWDLGAGTTLNSVTLGGNTKGDYTGSPTILNTAVCGSGNCTHVAVADDGTDKKEQTPAPLYVVVEQAQGQLPTALGEGFKFGSSLKVELTNEGKDVTDLAMTLSFSIPTHMKDASLVVMFWNGSAWVEVSGGSVVNGFFVITVAQPGNYALVAK